MFPRLIEIPLFGGIPINTYGFMIMVGFLLATWIGVRRARTVGLNTDLLLDIGIIAMIFGILGAKLNYVIQYAGEFSDPAKRSIFEFGDGGFHPLGALLGVIPFWFWFVRTRKEKKIPIVHWTNGVLLGVTLLFATVGARAYFIWSYPEEYNFSVYRSWQSGFVLYGGLIAAIAAGTLYTRMRGESVGKVADLAAPSVMIGLAFGRIGCFLNGCCFGGLCSNFLGVAYPKVPVTDEPTRFSPAFIHHRNEYNLDWDATHSLPVHATQLYETFFAIAAFFFLSFLWKKWKKRGTGQIFLIMGMMYAVWRFIVEIMRDDPGRDLASLGMTYSQAVSILVFVFCGVWIFLLNTKKKKKDEEGSGTDEDKKIEPPPEAKKA